MKKIIALTLALLLVLTLAACGGKEDSKGSTVSHLTDEQLLEKIQSITDGKTGDTPVENISFAQLADMGADPAGLFGNWFNGMAVPEGAKVVVNQAMMMGQAHVVLLIQPAEGTDITQLQKDLTANTNPRWNICTEANFVESAVKDGLILFMMTTTGGESKIDAQGILDAFNA